ncbi:BT4734/BF3469 family protein [Rhodohalobacter sp.]|uniref:BT4734/BF3469 family protein n=1 Tax=Rhodohalobacter sp. TaxID=1974210 RepID=UPI002ACE9DC9|nr:BT4734/BF3469 family protein [Rhodohalobacter sp.]MDZ7757231.1 BT4734/BF3469 family protein [Rhodohalobacter sp.]
MKKNQFKLVTFSGMFEERNTDSLLKFSHLICLDIDDVEDCNTAKSHLINQINFKPLLLFISPSGNGIKAVYRVSNITANQVNQAYEYLAELVESKLGLTVDRAPKSVVSGCFLPWDPEAYLNEEAEAVISPKTKIASPHVPTITQPKDEDLKKVEACVDYIEKSD